MMIIQKNMNFSGTSTVEDANSGTIEIGNMSGFINNDGSFNFSANVISKDNYLAYRDTFTADLTAFEKEIFNFLSDYETVKGETEK